MRSSRRLAVGIIDLIAKRPIDTAYTRLMYPSFASIMPQVVAVWAEELGHEVRYLTYTGREDLRRELSADVDVLFVCAFTQAAYLAYAISSLFRKKGAVTVLGGPHARSYAHDAERHFDYVLGLTDKALVHDLLAGLAPQPNGRGLSLSAKASPVSLPGIRERWKFIQRNLAKAPIACAVPMLGSLGCPYTCNFCIDSQFDYRPLPYDQIREDLSFLRRMQPRPVVAWHDPNFGVRFDDYMRLIEEADGPGSIRFIAESSLSLLGDAHLDELRRHGFLGLIVGIESWFDFNDKARQGNKAGLDKVEAVADHVNRIARRIPYIQTNFVWGLDQDTGALPFELNKRFVDLAPAAFPSHSVFTAYGNAAPIGVELAREDRVLDVPFQFLDTASIHNVQLKNYSAVEFYQRLSDVVSYSYSSRATFRRLRGNAHPVSSFAPWMNVIRSVASRSRVRHYTQLSRRFATDREFRAFASRELQAPAFFRHAVKGEIGPFYDYLSADVRASLEHGRAA
jgi:hypothetical protein